MLLTLIITVALLAAFVQVLWPDPTDRPDGSDAGSGAGEPAREPETLEGALVAQLATGDITRRQYVRAMEILAARDDERHPLAVPPDTGPAATGG
ncbi:hypothetical protein AB0J80_22055 [Actinoplanes sp. NPDC049548]|uniref:hypothetical protein n=1 Tax=Actinoplanes sp. NPDC049548 TaxID=3155152 RepID=UPI003447A4C8